MSAMKRLYEARQEAEELLQQEDPFLRYVKGTFEVQQRLAELCRNANKKQS